METIGQVIRKSSSGSPSRQESGKPRNLSKRQEEHVNKFQQWFPTEQDVLAFFAPVKWPGCLRQSENGLLLPTVTLWTVDYLYIEGTAKSIVKNNMRGIFHLAEPRDFINENALDMTAELFVAKLGAEISVFAALYYFAAYLTEYKSTYGKFDMQDILRQCRRSFLPDWRAKVVRMENREHDEEDNDEPKGHEAMLNYVRRAYIDKGIDPRSSSLYQLGFLSDTDITTITTK